MYTEDTILGLIDCAIDVGGLRLSVPFASLTSVVGAFYKAGRECKRDPRVMLGASSDKHSGRPNPRTVVVVNSRAPILG